MIDKPFDPNNLFSDRNNPDAVTLYREFATKELETLNPYFDDRRELIAGLVKGADSLRNMAFHGAMDLEWWQRYARGLFLLARAQTSILNSLEPGTTSAGNEDLTNSLAAFRGCAGIEPATPPYRQPEPKETH